MVINSVYKQGEDGSLVQVNNIELQNKKVALFFGAAWCTYCQRALPYVIETYNLIKPRNFLEIVYVPFDNKEEDYKTYSAKMPWLVLPFGVQYTSLLKRYNVNSLPSLRLVDTDNSISTVECNDRATLHKEPAVGDSTISAEERFNYIFNM